MNYLHFIKILAFDFSKNKVSNYYLKLMYNNFSVYTHAHAYTHTHVHIYAVICLLPPLLFLAFFQISFLSRRIPVLSCRMNLALLTLVFRVQYFASSSLLLLASPPVLHHHLHWTPKLPSVFVPVLLSRLTSDTQDSFLCKGGISCERKDFRIAEQSYRTLLTETEPNLIWIPFFCSLPLGFFPKPNANFCFFASDWSQSESQCSSVLSGERSLPLSSSFLPSVL